jgi:nicotinamide riboside transporter PnuC
VITQEPRGTDGWGRAQHLTFQVAQHTLRWKVLEQLIKFKGADWVGMIFGLISTYYLAKEKRMGFLFGVIGGLGWIVFGILTGSIASILANLSFIAINCHGYLRWKRKHKGRKDSS